jgi:hypothetical protein
LDDYNKTKHANIERTKYIINIILGTKFDFVKYKAIFNKSPPDLYFTKIPTQIPFNKMWVQTNVSQISTNLHLGEYSPINSTNLQSTLHSTVALPNFSISSNLLSTNNVRT